MAIAKSHRNTLMTEILGGSHPWMDSPEAEEYIKNEGKTEVHDYKVVVLFGETLLRRLFVILEGYDKKKEGRVKRAYEAQFTKAERKVMSKWYLKIYAWYFRTGIPYDGVRMSV